jgi:hypothetical protein
VTVSGPHLSPASFGGSETTDLFGEGFAPARQLAPGQQCPVPREFDLLFQALLAAPLSSGEAPVAGGVDVGRTSQESEETAPEMAGPLPFLVEQQFPQQPDVEPGLGRAEQTKPEAQQSLSPLRGIGSQDVLPREVLPPLLAVPRGGIKGIEVQPPAHSAGQHESPNESGSQAFPVSAPESGKPSGVTRSESIARVPGSPTVFFLEQQGAGQNLQQPSPETAVARADGQNPPGFRVDREPVLVPPSPPAVTYAGDPVVFSGWRPVASPDVARTAGSERDGRPRDDLSLRICRSREKPLDGAEMAFAARILHHRAAQRASGLASALAEAPEVPSWGSRETDRVIGDTHSVMLGGTRSEIAAEKPALPDAILPSHTAPVVREGASNSSLPQTGLAGTVGEKLSVAEPDAPATPPREPAREISLRVSEAGRDNVEVRLKDRAGELRLTVHARESELVRSLRDGLPHLVTRLQQGGFEARAWRPAAADSAWQSPLAGGRATDDVLRGFSKDGVVDWVLNDGSGRRNQDHPQRHWIEDLEKPSSAADNSSDRSEFDDYITR